MNVSIVVPTYSGSKSITQCIDHLPRGCEIIIIDGDDIPLAKKRNLGAKRSTKDYILFCDDDNQIVRGSVEAMVKYMDSYHDVAVAGMIGIYDGIAEVKVCDSGSFRKWWFTYDKYVNMSLLDVPHNPYEVDDVANVFMVRRDIFAYLNGFNVEHYPIDLDEADLCFRARKLGYRVMMIPEAVTAHRSLTYSRIPNFRRPLNAYYQARNRIVFHKEHHGQVPCFPLLLGAFLAVFIPAYVASLCLQRNFTMIPHFMRGVGDGLRFTVRSK